MGATPPNYIVNAVTHSDRARTLIDNENKARTIEITPEGYLVFVSREGSVTSLVDENGNPIMSHLAQEQLLSDVLMELKKINLHMAFLTDIIITNEEII